MQNPLVGTDPVALMRRMLAEATAKAQKSPENLHVVCDDEGKAEIGPWLTRTGWKDTFNGEDMSVLVEFTKKDKGEDHVITWIDQSIPRILDHCMRGVKDLKIRGWDEIRYVMQSWQKDKDSDRPFLLYYKDLTSYHEVWKSLLFFCWRMFTEEKPGLEFTDHQLKYLYQLRGLSFDADKECVDKIVLALCISLIEHQDANLSLDSPAGTSPREGP
jgi:hypothetical protein